MVAIRAANASKFAEAPPQACAAVLVFGTDDGLVSERAKLIVDAFSKRDDPAAEVIRIEDADLENEPDRLLVELQTVPMFGGGKVVRSTLGRRVNGALFKQVFEAGPPPALLVVEGGNLKPSDVSRKLFEGAAWAAAVPCYADTERDLATIANDMIQAAGRSLEPEARAVLLERLGADRALTRGEIEKLLLYTEGRDVVTTGDVLAVVGDASDFKMDQIVSSAAAGDSPQTLLLAMQRYYIRLHRLRSAVDGGSSLDDAMRRLRPPVHFSQKDAVSAQCRAWSLASLSQAVARISAAVKAARLNADVEAPLAERLLIDLAAHARSHRR